MIIRYLKWSMKLYNVICLILGTILLVIYVHLPNLNESYYISLNESFMRSIEGMVSHNQPTWFAPTLLLIIYLFIRCIFATSPQCIIYKPNIKQKRKKVL